MTVHTFFTALPRVAFAAAFILALFFCGRSSHAQTGLVLDPYLDHEVLSIESAIVTSVVPQSDGRYVVLGSYVYVDGVKRTGLVRLNSDGSLDPSFPILDVEGTISLVTGATDGKLYVGGRFSSINGEPRPGLARLSADGALDTTFVPVAPARPLLRKLLPLSDGGLYVLSDESADPGMTIQRFASDGQPAAGFTTIELPDAALRRDMAASPSGRIVLLALPQGTSSPSDRIRVFLPTGAPDTSFAVDPELASLLPTGVAVRHDEFIVLAGSGSVHGPDLFLLYPDGHLDPTFSGYAPYDTFGLGSVVQLTDGSFVGTTAASSSNPPLVVRFLPNGDFDAEFSATGSPDRPASVQLVALPDGDFLAFGRFFTVGGVPAPFLVRVGPGGQLRSTPRVDLLSSGSIACIVPRAGDATLIGGSFTQLGEIPRTNLARLGADDGVDAAFPQLDGSVADIAIAADGKPVVVGAFSAPTGGGTAGAIRLHHNGTVDGSFLQGFALDSGSYFAIAPFADGALVLGGSFRGYDPNTGHWSIMRVLPDGGVDPAFLLNGANSDQGPWGPVNSLNVDSAGRLLLSATNSRIQNVDLPSLARTAASGLLDQTFLPAVGLRTGRGSRAIVPLADGRFFALGQRTDLPTSVPPGVVRFNADGTIDDAFPGTTSESETFYTAITLAPDGSLIAAAAPVGGGDGTVQRFLPDGTRDTAFAIAVEGRVSALAYDAAGRLWLGGGFRAINGQRRISLARFAPPRLFVRIEGSPQRVIVPGGSITLTATTEGETGAVTLQWRRNGEPISGATEPTLSVSNFDAALAGEYSVVATDEVASATSTKVSLLLPVAPTITVQPSSRSESIGGAFVLRITSTGFPEPAYQWFKDGVALADETRRELRRRNLTSADAGSYTVQVSNLGGSVTSNAAFITVSPLSVDPLFAPAVAEMHEYLSVSVRAGKADDTLVVTTNLGTALNGVARYGTYRMRPDGTIDGSLNVSIPNLPPPLLVQPDGTMYVPREETDLSTGFAIRRLRRFSASGGMDADFGPSFGHDTIWSVQALADGRLLVVGNFTTVNGVARRSIARLTSSGVLDETFNSGELAGIQRAWAHADGSVIVAIGGSADTTFRRLTPAGAVDSTFTAAVANSWTEMRLLGLQDGSTLVYGDFSAVNGVPRQGYARLLDDGTVASNFTGLPDAWRFWGAGLQPDGSIVLVGTSRFSGGPLFWRHLSANGDVLGDREHVFSGSTDSIAVALQPGGGAVVSGRVVAFGGRAVRGFVRLGSDGEIDAAFSATLGRYGSVGGITPLAAGRYLIAGRFSEVGGLERRGLAIVGPDGRADPGFVPDLPEGSWCVSGEQLASGSFLVRGYFPPFSGFFATVSSRVLRGDGSKDPDFEALRATGVEILAVAPDGRFIVEEPSDPPIHDQNRIRRLNADLAPDSTFVPATWNRWGTFLPLRDGRFLVYTLEFKDGSGTSRSGWFRLQTNGLVDDAFAAPTATSGLYTLHEAPDGKFLATGAFDTLNGVARPGIARLLDSGAVDSTFVPATSGLPSNPEVSHVAFERDGKIVLFGRYIRPPGLSFNDFVLTRLNPDGSHDPSISFTMNTFLGNSIGAIATRDNGDIIVGGAFPELGGSPRLSLARITTNRFQANATRERLAVPLGGTGYLDVRVTGASLPTYRWMKDGVDLPNGDRAVLALHDFSAADVGVYEAEVASADGALSRAEPVEVVLSEETVAAPLTPLTFSETGGLGSVRVDAPAGTAWSVQNLPSWAALNPAPASTGSRTVSFQLEPNLTGAERSATVTIAGRSFELRQAAASGRLVNISTRGRSGTGDNVMIVGFIMSGGQPLDILGRGVGPTLNIFGLGGLLPDPTIELYQGQSVIGGNDNWDGGVDRDLVLSESRRVSAFDLHDDAGDAAMLSNLSPGAYTAIVRDAAGREGITLAEFYDRTPTSAFNPYNRVINISTRGRVGTGDEVVIAGFVITGSVPKQVLIRGVGPGLHIFGLTNLLADPFIRVVQNGETIVQNDDWAFSAQADVVAAAFDRTQAFQLDTASKDAALVATLQPGLYTVILSGADGGEGIGLIEVYDLE